MVTISQVWLIAYSRDGNLPSPVSLAWRMRSSTRACARCLASRNASCPVVVLVTKAWSHQPSRSSNSDSCAPGRGRSRRTITPRPGRPRRQIQQPGQFGDIAAPRTPPSASVAGVQIFGTRSIASRTFSVTANPTEVLPRYGRGPVLVR